MITVYCDGLYEPRYDSNGWSCWAWIALNEELKTVAFDKGCLGRGREKFSNNVAEYAAVGKAIQWLLKKGYEEAHVLTDSLLVVNQVNGSWQCNAEHLKPLCAKIQLLKEDKRFYLRWIPREENQLADDLTNEAYEDARQ